MSGVHVAMCPDPFLRAMAASPDSSGDAVTRACADDIGATIRPIELFIRYFDVFEIARKTSGLSLKSRKCVLVPVGAAFRLHDVSVIKDWLARFIPSWSDFRIEATARYLGFWLGPAA